MRLIWSKLARAEFDRQLDYYAEFNEHAALRMADEVERQVNLLREHPGIGSRLKTGESRKLVISRTPFIAIYRVDRDVQVVRLFHGAQDWPGRY